MAEDLNITIRAEDGAFWATVAEYPGVFASGDTLDALRASLEEGISFYVSTPEHAMRATLDPLALSQTSIATQAHLASA